MLRFTPSASTFCNFAMRSSRRVGSIVMGSSCSSAPRGFRDGLNSRPTAAPVRDLATVRDGAAVVDRVCDTAGRVLEVLLGGPSSEVRFEYMT